MNELTTQSAAPLAQKPSNMGILNPTSLKEAMDMATILSDSTIVPKDFIGKPGNVLIAIQWGQELGLAPLQSMQSIAVINGRPTIWGDAMLALVQGSGRLASIKEELSDDRQEATCTVLRTGHTEPVVRSFSMDDAKKAGLAGKPGPWQQYPKRMLQLRARGFALRDAFADVLRGVMIAEEARDTPVMRDVTPEEDAASDKPKTTAGRIKGKIAAKKADKVSLDDLLNQIAEATDEAGLAKVGEQAKQLPDADRDTMRAAYRARLEELRRPVEQPEYDEDTGELFAMTDEQRAELEAAEADYKAESQG